MNDHRADVTAAIASNGLFADIDALLQRPTHVNHSVLIGEDDSVWFVPIPSGIDGDGRKRGFTLYLHEKVNADVFSIYYGRRGKEAVTTVTMTVLAASWVVAVYWILVTCAAAIFHSEPS